MDGDADTPSIRDVTNVDVDRLDSDSIDRLQLVLRRLQRHDDDHDDVRDDDDVTDGRVTSHSELQQQAVSGE